MDPRKVQVEYIWLDGGKTPEQEPRPQEPRSKMQVVKLKVAPQRALNAGQLLAQIPEWGFDGSSTVQAEGEFSDCKLLPVKVIIDPIRGYPNLLALCEVRNPDGSVHPSNKRARLAKLAEKYANEEVWVGIEQEYTLLKGGVPLGFVAQPSPPARQDRYYCGVGADVIFGREHVEEHTRLCLEAGLSLCGINAEVMPGQWEHQIGALPPLDCADELWFARWFNKRVGEKHGLTVSLSPKPWPGDWNGAGAHTNFSTKAMREDGGLDAIYDACFKLKKRHKAHIKVYGLGNEARLTGKHETASIKDFRYGVSDRGASIRIPMATANAGRGYFEDRRPAANMDPYEVLTALLETVCGNGFRK